MTSLHKHDVFKSKTLYFYHAFIKSAKQYTDFQSDIAKIELSFWRYYSMSIINNQTMRRLMHQNSNTTDKLKQNINNKLQE